MPTPQTTRRDILAGAFGAAALGALTSRAAAKPEAGRIDIEKNCLRTFMLMRGALDGQLVIGCCSGAYYGVVNGEVTPHFSFVSATFTRYRPAAAGGYEGASYEVPFFTDLATGEALKTWKNPTTGEVVPVPQPQLPPSRLKFTPDLAMELPGAPAGLTMSHDVTAPLIIGNDVWLQERTFAALSIPHVAQKVRFTEFVTLYARRSDLENPHATRVPTLTYYQGTSGWRPWQKMGDRPGSLSGNGYGRYGVTMAELPPAWLRIARSLRPEVLQDPAAPLAALLATK